MAAKKTASTVSCSLLLKARCGVQAKRSLPVSKKSKARRGTSTASRVSQSSLQQEPNGFSAGKVCSMCVLQTHPLVFICEAAPVEHVHHGLKAEQRLLLVLCWQG